MVFKLLAIIAILFLVYLIFFKKSRENNVTTKKKEDIEDEMVECPICKTYVSKKEGILSNGYYYCSKECLLKK